MDAEGPGRPGGADGTRDRADDGRSWWRRSPLVRLVLVVGVALGLAALALAVGQRNRDAFDGTVARVQEQAVAEVGAVDLRAFEVAWNAEKSGATPGAAEALLPRLDGADLARFVLVADPPQLIVDYQVDKGGQQGCIRVNRSLSGTTVLMDRHTCQGAFVSAGGD